MASSVRLQVCAWGPLLCLAVLRREQLHLMRDQEVSKCFCKLTWCAIDEVGVLEGLFLPS